MKSLFLMILTFIAILSISACGRGLTSDMRQGMPQATYNAQRTPIEELKREGTIVFVRPKHFRIFGTKSLRDYIEIVYEKAVRNRAGLLEVSIGIRNIGGRRFYDYKAPDFVLSLKTAFYAEAGQNRVPVYETNWENIKFVRGATEAYKVICPVKSGAFYQVTISEVLK